MPADSTRQRDAMLASAQTGDSAALGRLLDGYSAYLALLARAQLGPTLRGKVDPDDIVQATFLDAHRQFENFRGGSEPELTAWLRTILAGQLALQMRRFLGTAARDARLERRIENDLTDNSRVLDRGLVSPGSTPSFRASRREQAVLLADALQQLPDDYREVIVLRHVEGLPTKDVARRMGRSEDSVQKLWVRALAKLRSAMGDDDA